MWVYVICNLFEFLDFSIDDVDDDTLVSEVLADMMNKEIHTGVDLGMTPLKKLIHDPTPKMDIRHKQVSWSLTYLHDIVEIILLESGNTN